MEYLRFCYHQLARDLYIVKILNSSAYSRFHFTSSGKISQNRVCTVSLSVCCWHRLWTAATLYVQFHTRTNRLKHPMHVVYVKMWSGRQPSACLFVRERYYCYWRELSSCCIYVHNIWWNQFNFSPSITERNLYECLQSWGKVIPYSCGRIIAVGSQWILYFPTLFQILWSAE
jgi:hypothetical protein